MFFFLTDSHQYVQRKHVYQHEQAVADPKPSAVRLEKSSDVIPAETNNVFLGKCAFWV